MDIHTIQQTIDIVTEKLKESQERYNLHPNDQYLEGKVIGVYEVLKRVEEMLNDELEERDQLHMGIRHGSYSPLKEQ